MIDGGNLMTMDECNIFDFQDIIKQLRKTRTICKTLEKILDDFFDGIVIWDKEGYILNLNKSCEHMLDINKEDLIGKNIKKLAREGGMFKYSILQILKTEKEVTLERELKNGDKVIITSMIMENSNLIVTIVRNIDKIFQTEYNNLKEKINYEYKQHALIEQGIVAKNKNMLNALNRAKKVAKLDTTVLIIGETGTGKGIVANYIYMNSNRCNNKFIKINCSAVSENLFNIENCILNEFINGTIFLDEVGKLSLDMQLKLLILLKKGNMNIRVIAATNNDLKCMVSNGLFIRDLYYMLNVFPINIYPIRKRRSDIIPLAKYFLQNFNKEENTHKSFTPSALQALMKYSWYGNVIEIKNVVHRAAIVSKDKIFEKDLLLVDKLQKINIDFESFSGAINLKEIVEKLELNFINQSFIMYGNVRDAAKALNMDASTYVRKRKKYMEKYPTLN